MEPWLGKIGWKDSRNWNERKVLFGIERQKRATMELGTFKKEQRKINPSIFNHLDLHVLHFQCCYV